MIFEHYNSKYFNTILSPKNLFYQGILQTKMKVLYSVTGIPKAMDHLKMDKYRYHISVTVNEGLVFYRVCDLP